MFLNIYSNMEFYLVVIVFLLVLITNIRLVFKQKVLRQLFSVLATYSIYYQIILTIFLVTLIIIGIDIRASIVSRFIDYIYLYYFIYYVFLVYGSYLLKKLKLNLQNHFSRTFLFLLN